MSHSALQMKRENFLDRINSTFHHKERQLNLRQEETGRLLRAIEHAEQFMACVEHLDKRESTVHTVALSGDYFRLILRQTDCQLESVNVDVRLKRPVVWLLKIVIQETLVKVAIQNYSQN